MPAEPTTSDWNARELGPTVPRWRLGVELYQLRLASGVPEELIAEKLACPISRISKIEAGYVGLGRAELLLMLEVYGADHETREALLELSKLGKQRGWWSEKGKLPASFSHFLSMESVATTLQVYEPMVVYGLMQTDAYARALIEATLPQDSIDQERIECEMESRQVRKRQVLEAEPPELQVILGESALRQVVGGADIMREQLAHLLALTYGPTTLQVLPFSAVRHGGSLGAFTILGFPNDVHSPVVYVEGQAGNLYLEKPQDIDRCSLAFNQIATAALDPTESTRLIAAVAKEFAER